MHNIIIFGEAGSGKSSLVNMIVGRDVANISDSAYVTTFQNDVYQATIGDTTFNIYDTAGLNEGDQGRIPHLKAAQNLYTLIQQLEGVSLLIYCMRSRVKENASANWILFHRVICQGKVPIVVVVTGLDNREDPDDWWREKRNKDALNRNGMRTKNVACVVSYAGRQNEHEAVYEASQVKLRNMIMKTCRREPWSAEKDKWLANIYQEVLSKLCFASRSRSNVVHIAYGGGQSTSTQKLQEREQVGHPYRMTENNRTIPRNIIVFGQTGSGKSSMINMLAGKSVAGVSDSAFGSTPSNQPYDISHGNDVYTFWDTAGLNEADNGTVSSQAAVQNLLDLVKDKDRGINLLVYCIRPRLVDIIRINHDLFWKIICMEKVPIVFVVTGLEGREDMDDWWRENEQTIRKMKMVFDGQACITSIEGRGRVYEKAYKESAEKVWELVRKHSKREPWYMTDGLSARAQQKLVEYEKKYKTRSENGIREFLRELRNLFFLSRT